MPPIMSYQMGAARKEKYSRFCRRRGLRADGVGSGEDARRQAGRFGGVAMTIRVVGILEMQIRFSHVVGQREGVLIFFVADGFQLLQEFAWGAVIEHAG